MSIDEIKKKKKRIVNDWIFLFKSYKSIEH